MVDPKLTGSYFAHDIKQKVVEWNERYEALSKEVRLKDMDGAEYEEVVGYELLDICREDKNLALAVFNHPDNKGGWMAGDVARWIHGFVGC